MQPGLPSTSKAAFMGDPPVFSGLSQEDVGESSTAAAAAAAGDTGSPTSNEKKKKKQQQQQQQKGRESTFLDSLVSRLEDNRLVAGDPETARKLQEINRSQNDSNVILKKVLNIAFVTTGVALLLSVIIVIVFTSIVKHSSKVDRIGVATDAEEENTNGIFEKISKDNDDKNNDDNDNDNGYVHHSQQQRRQPVKTVVVSLDNNNNNNNNNDSDDSLPRVGESSSVEGNGARSADPDPDPDGEGRRVPGPGPATKGKAVYRTRCQAVPLTSNGGEVKMGQMCYQTRGD